VLKQGTGQARNWTPKPRTLALTEGKIEPAPKSTSAQILLPGKVPTPPITYGPDDTRSALHPLSPGKRPLLVVCWASWCPNCRGELLALTNHRSALRQAGIDVLALSVDHLSTTPPSAESDPTRYLQEIGFAFPHGIASAGTLSGIQHLQNSLFDMNPPSSVPLSLLLDSKRKLIAIYRGRIPVDSLENHAALAHSTAPERRDAALPFAGRWYTLAATDSQIAELIGKRFQTKYPEIALDYFQTALESEQDAAGQQRLLTKLIAGHHRLGLTYGQRAKFQLAEKHFREGLRLAPRSAELHHDYGVLLARLERYEQAESQFVKALEINPNYGLARENLEAIRRRKVGRPSS
jgi:tetratricopeptide (TPR) repeat protein